MGTRGPGGNTLWIPPAGTHPFRPASTRGGITTTDWSRFVQRDDSRRYGVFLSAVISLTGESNLGSIVWVVRWIPPPDNPRVWSNGSRVPRPPKPQKISFDSPLQSHFALVRVGFWASPDSALLASWPDPGRDRRLRTSDALRCHGITPSSGSRVGAEVCIPGGE